MWLGRKRLQEHVRTKAENVWPASGLRVPTKLHHDGALRGRVRRGESKLRLRVRSQVLQDGVPHAQGELREAHFCCAHQTLLGRFLLQGLRPNVSTGVRAGVWQ